MQVRNIHPLGSVMIGGSRLRRHGEEFELTDNAVESAWLDRGWLVPVTVDAPASPVVAVVVPPCDGDGGNEDLDALPKAALWRRICAAGISDGVSYQRATAAGLAALLRSAALLEG